MEFDAVCHKYTWLVDRAGGLNDKLADGLRQELSDRGFTISQLSGTTTGAYGGNLDLYVAASFLSSKINSRLTAEEVVISLEYQSSTFCRILKNFDAVP